MKYGSSKYGQGTYGKYYGQYIFNRKEEYFATSVNRMILNYNEMNRIEQNLKTAVDCSNYLGYTDITFTPKTWVLNDFPCKKDFDRINDVTIILRNAFPLDDDVPLPRDKLIYIDYNDINTIERVCYEIYILFNLYSKSYAYASDLIFTGGI